MNESDQDVPIEQLRVLQIIAGALILGLLSFLTVVLLMFSGQGQQPAPELPMLSLVAAAMLVGCIPVSIILPKIITRTALRQILDGTFQVPAGAASDQLTTPAKLLAVRQTTMIIGLALLEGTGFVGCVAYMLEHQVQVLGVVGLVIVAMLLRFPTSRQVSAWLEQQTQALLDMQQARDSGQQ